MIKKILYDWNGLNQKIFHQIYEITNFSPKFMKILILVTEFANYKNILYLIYFAASINFILVKREANFTTRDNYLRYFVIPFIQNFVIIFVTYCFTLGIVLIMKRFFIYPRPICLGNINIYNIERGFETVREYFNKRCVNDWSFPSAHASTSVIVGLYLLEHSYKRYIKIVITLYIFFVAISRVALGLHYPADVVTGIMIGFLSYYLCQYLCNLLFTKFYNNVRKIVEIMF